MNDDELRRWFATECLGWEVEDDELGPFYWPGGNILEEGVSLAIPLSGWAGCGRAAEWCMGNGYDVSLHFHKGWDLTFVVYSRSNNDEFRGRHPDDLCLAAIKAVYAAKAVPA